MAGLLSFKEKKRQKELELSGVAITEIYGSKRASSLFLCLSKALIIFLVCTGTITGFCDAFSLNYNKLLVIFFIALISILVSLVYVNKILFYSGYVILLILFTVELVRYYLYANSGFQAIMNRVRDAYGDHFEMDVIKSSEELYGNRNVTITIALIFIAFFLIIMYNITVSRYMNFAETFGISFILLEVPLYIGLKPPIISIILTMTGCIASGLLQRGSYARVKITGRKDPDYVRDKIFKKTYYTTRGNHKGILYAISFAGIFSLAICVFSLPAYQRGLGETENDSAKAILDDNIKILVQNGFYGFFNRYDSLNGLARGALGGVSSVSSDLQTDLVVEYVPYDNETLYLPGYYGTEYTGQRWNEYPGSASELDEEYIKRVTDSDMTAESMKINYLDMSFGMLVTPYITLAENVKGRRDNSFFTGRDGRDKASLYVSDIKYLPLPKVHYKKYDDSISEINGYDSYIDYNCYISNNLNNYLTAFVREHNNLGLDIKAYRQAVKENDVNAINEFRLLACKAIKKVFPEEYPYSLSPGKTPTDADFVRYFLETQKNGYCSHFASAAVMLLRHLGIPARYVEGYCIPPSLLAENGRKVDESGKYSVEVSDFYAHAWPEVYIEGKGFIPYEVTPPDFDNVAPASTGGIGEFLRNLLTVDLGLGDTSEDTISITDDTLQEIAQNDGPDLNIIIIPIGIVIGLACVFWILILLIRKIIKELRYRRWLKNGDYKKLVYGRYIEYVRKLKKKKMIKSENPLPMELAEELADYYYELKRVKKNQGRDISGDNSSDDNIIDDNNPDKNKLSEDSPDNDKMRENTPDKNNAETAAMKKEFEEIFGYVERVLYSPSYVSGAEEYEKFYEFLRSPVWRVLYVL